MAKRKLEEQVKTLEARVARLEKSVEFAEAETPYGQTMAEFLQTFSGIFENDPAFEEAARLGAEWRASFRPKVRQAASKKRGKNARARH